RAGLAIDRIDAVYAPLLVPGAEVEPGLPVVRDPLGVLDDRAVHVRDPKRTIGTGLEHRGTEPGIARCEELGGFLARGPAAGECGAVGVEDDAMDQVVNRFTDKEAGCELASEEIVAVWGRAIRGGDTSGGFGIIEPSQDQADGE